MRARIGLVTVLICALAIASGGAATAELEGEPRVAGVDPSQAAAPADSAFLSIHFGRTQWEQRDASCTSILPNSITLLQVAQELSSRGLTGVGNVVVSRTSSTSTRNCQSRLASASWNDLAVLRDTHRWSFVSAGSTYANMTTLSPAQQRAESCGSLQAFADHGHHRASGLFAYPNNKLTTSIQSNVVSTCFAYGRKYGSGINRRPVPAPYLQSTVSFNGGACNDLSQPCSDTASHGGRRYALPSKLRAAMQPMANQWSAVQFYRFVVGRRDVASDPTYAWDCTSANPSRHWTSRAEAYCWDDFRSALDAIPANVVVTDPWDIALSWGRAP